MPDGGNCAALWDTVDLTRETKSTRKGEARWTLRKSETIYGFAAWWSSDLGAGIALSTAPDAPRTHWEQLYFPLLKPVTAKPREAICLSLRSRSSEAAGTHLTWTATHLDAKGKQISRQTLDLDQGYLP